MNLWRLWSQALRYIFLYLSFEQQSQISWTVENYKRDIVKAKLDDTLFHLVKKFTIIGVMTSFNFGSLRNVDHPVVSNVILKHYLNSRPQEINLLTFFSAYEKEFWSIDTRNRWSTNTGNRDLQWKDDLHRIWYRLHSAAGSLFCSRFLLLQTVSQAN